MRKIIGWILLTSIMSIMWYHVLPFEAQGAGSYTLLKKGTFITGIVRSCCFDKKANTVKLFLKDGTCRELLGIDGRLYYKIIPCAGIERME